MIRRGRVSRMPLVLNVCREPELSWHRVTHLLNTPTRPPVALFTSFTLISTPTVHFLAKLSGPSKIRYRFEVGSNERK